MHPLLWIMLLFPAFSSASERVRHIECRTDQVVTVRTALGIATIIQVPDRPNSVVVGDQEKFKVEYLDQAITIKPLQAGAKSNLYVYTDYQRFNVQLVTGAESAADYVVYLQNIISNSKDSKASIKWSRVNRTMENDGIAFETARVGVAHEGVLLIEFQLKTKGKETIDPAWFWLTQDGKTKPIHRLFLSSLLLKSGETAQGVMQVLRSDLEESKNLRVEMRRQKTTSVVIPKVSAWK